MKLLQAIRSQTLLLFLTFILILSSTVSAQNEKTLFPVKDNTLYENANGAFSNGSGVHLFVGKTNSGAIRRGLITFAISDNHSLGRNN